MWASLVGGWKKVAWARYIYPRCPILDAWVQDVLPARPPNSNQTGCLWVGQGFEGFLDLSEVFLMQCLGAVLPPEGRFFFFNFNLKDFTMKFEVSYPDCIMRKCKMQFSCFLISIFI